MTYEAFVNERPDPEYFRAIRPLVLAESDRGAAVMLSALVEQELEMALRKKLTHLSSDELNDWFCGSVAPFKTFEAKIKLCRGMEIYDLSVEEQLTRIRKIRNAFAHRALPADFNSPPLSGLKEPLFEGLLGLGFSNREVFAAYCLGTVAALRGIPHQDLVKA